MICNLHTSYLDSPEFLSAALHVTSSVSTPIHLIAFYVILQKTPAYLNSVKWYLLNLHVWIVSFDYSVGFLMEPVLVLPCLAVLPRGIMSEVGVPTLFQGLMVVFFLGNVHVSITAIFESRFFLFCDFIGKKYWAVLRWLWLLAQYVGIFLVLCYVATLVPDQSYAIIEILEKIPCLPDNFYTNIFLIADDSSFQVCASIIFILITCIEVLTFVIFIFWNFMQHQKKQRSSQKTLNTQKMVFFALTVQMGVPLVMLIVPLTYALVSVISLYHNQKVTNMFVIIGALHGVVSTLVMLFIHKPYRRAMRGLVPTQRQSSQLTTPGYNVAIHMVSRNVLI